MSRPTIRRFFRSPSSLVLLAMLCLVAPSDGIGQPRDKCGPERVDAENFYLEGVFDETIRLLQACIVREELFVEEAVPVYRLMGLAYLNKGDMGQAQQAIRDLLQIVPAYEADPIQDPPSYTTLVAVVRQEVAAEAMVDAQQTPAEEPPVVPEKPQPRVEDAVSNPVLPQPQPARRRSVGTPKAWLLATGGAIVVVAAVALALGGGSSGGAAAPR